MPPEESDPGPPDDEGPGDEGPSGEPTDPGPGTDDRGEPTPPPGAGAGPAARERLRDGSLRTTVEPGSLPRDAPTPPELAEFFRVTEVRSQDDRVYYFGYALVDTDRLSRELWPTFDQAGFDVRHVEQPAEDMLVARRSEPGIDGIPWTHLVLFALTVASTLFAGSMWFGVDPVAEPFEIWRGWPFAVGVLTVLGVHELGHYVMTRYHGVEATLPYFIPVPTLIGTMGAVIRMKGRMPNRRALFDIGVAGPLAGLAATIAVTVVGLHLEPVTLSQELAEQEGTYRIAIGFPPLLEFLAWATGQQLYLDDPLTSVHPLVIAGWVGMLVTFLNLIPVGQFDGGHVVRAVAPEYQQSIGAVVPGLLYSLAGYLLLFEGVGARNVVIWIVWGTVALAVATVGPAKPVDDQTELGWRRTAVGVATLLLGLTCFAWVPIAVVG